MTNEYRITVPSPPTETQIDTLWQNGSHDRMTKLLNSLIDRGLGIGLLVVRDGVIVPANEALQFASEPDIIKAPLVMEVPR
jgi:hypothetical protein